MLILHFNCEDQLSSTPGAKATFRKSSGEVDFSSGKKKKMASVLLPLCKAFGPIFMFGVMLKVVQDVMTFISPKILEYVLFCD